MSKESDLPNSVYAANNYVQYLARMGCVDQVLLTGSRSPLHHKVPTEHSDWDFVVVSKIANLSIPHPRIVYKVMHADLICVDPETAKHIPDSVEIWPTDVHGVLNNVV